MREQEVLVGDVGGTSVRFALAHATPDCIAIDHFEKLPGDQFGCFEDAIETYLDHQNIRPKAALFALAGPVADDKVRLTNRPWSIDARIIEDRFGFGDAHLVNDFKAMARAVPELTDGHLSTISGGDLKLDENILVAGAGTGLGVAALIADGPNNWIVLSSEGGHAAFAPQTDRESDLRDWLAKNYGYVSNELVCSGIGLEPVHRGLCALSGVPFEAQSPRDILTAAASGDAIASEICTLRARTILSAAGDAALTIGATGGIVLAGGVSTRLEEYLKSPESLSRFHNRGPRSDYMAQIPIKMIRHETAPLIGAAALYFKDKDDLDYG